MGKAARKKWANRTVTASAAELAQTKPKDTSAKVPIALRWCRNVGISSICIGALGFVQAFFWPSVIAIYAGVILLLIDLWFEDFRPSSWKKIPIAVVILILCELFTQCVVLRKDPVVVGWIFRNDRLEVYINNASNDDYSDMDLKIKPDFPGDFVRDARQETSMPNVSFVDSVPVVLEEKGEKMLEILHTHIPGEKYSPETAYTNFLRFRCDKLPKDTTLKFSMALIKPAKSTAVQVNSVSEVLVTGNYKGKFRTYEIAMKALEPVSNKLNLAP